MKRGKCVHVERQAGGHTISIMAPKLAKTLRKDGANEWPLVHSQGAHLHTPIKSLPVSPPPLPAPSLPPPALMRIMSGMAFQISSPETGPDVFLIYILAACYTPTHRYTDTHTHTDDCEITTSIGHLPTFSSPEAFLGKES